MPFLSFVASCGIPSTQIHRIPSSKLNDVYRNHALILESQKKRTRNEAWVRMISASTFNENGNENGNENENETGSDANNQEPPRFSPKGMTVDELFTRSVGTWKSQRSSHNLLWQHVEQGESEIIVESLEHDDATVADICAMYNVEPRPRKVENGDEYPHICQCCRMSWEGSSDWEKDEVLSGSTIMVVIKDGPYHGRLLRSVGYAESIPAIGSWVMRPDDGMFVLETSYDRAAAEERIWFVTPNMRMRVALIKTQSGIGVINASLSTEIRKMS
mmetsp:Transcript_1693/g.2896  ORF Transcript_1693/g.2896 Transcript_1693/m.2896 type:complete len:274 (+) Transcript_1693:2-823(+)